MDFYMHIQIRVAIVFPYALRIHTAYLRMHVAPLDPELLTIQIYAFTYVQFHNFNVPVYGQNSLLQMLRFR